MKLNTNNRTPNKFIYTSPIPTLKQIERLNKCHLTKNGETFYTCISFNSKFKPTINMYNNSFMTKEAPYKFLLDTCPFCKTDLTPYSFEEPTFHLEKGDYSFQDLFYILLVGFPFTLSDTNMDLKSLINKIHKQNVDAGWWIDPITGLNTTSKKGEEPKCNVSEKLCLIHSEISEALKGYRKNLMDDKLPTRPNIEVELADAFIRICDLSAGLGLDLTGAVLDKLKYNETRADHKIENKLKENGKRF